MKEDVIYVLSLCLRPCFGVLFSPLCEILASPINDAEFIQVTSVTESCWDMLYVLCIWVYILLRTQSISAIKYGAVTKWKHFPRYWPFVKGIHRWPVDSPHKGQWRGALVFSLICACTNGWVNNRDASYLRRHRAHYDVTVMIYTRFHTFVLYFVVVII